MPQNTRSRTAAQAGPTGYPGAEWQAAIGAANGALAQIAQVASPLTRCRFLQRVPLLLSLGGRPRHDRLVAACPTRGS